MRLEHLASSQRLGCYSHVRARRSVAGQPPTGDYLPDRLGQAAALARSHVKARRRDVVTARGGVEIGSPRSPPHTRCFFIILAIVFETAVLGSMTKCGVMSVTCEEDADLERVDLICQCVAAGVWLLVHLWFARVAWVEYYSVKQGGRQPTQRRRATLGVQPLLGGAERAAGEAAGRRDSPRGAPGRMPSARRKLKRGSTRELLANLPDTDPSSADGSASGHCRTEPVRA